MSAPEPYFSDGQVSLFVGDCREVLPALGLEADLVLADPPYGETSLPWDKWPDGWLKAVAPVSRSMWCFGSLRMYLEHGSEFKSAGWKLSQDIIWEKHNGSGFDTDRFKRVHEQPTHWYRGPWSGIRHETPMVAVDERQKSRFASRAAGDHRGEISSGRYDYDGSRLARSVIFARSMHGRAIHKTQKPGALLEPMITYAAPPAGLSWTRSREAGRRS